MRTNFGLDYSCIRQEMLQIWGLPQRPGPTHDREDENGEGTSSAPDLVEREDLPYKVELWDAAKAGVEQVLAVTASAGIGFAAFYGATREFPDRYITLRHKGGIISRWNEPGH
jgi:hypothetical protein